MRTGRPELARTTAPGRVITTGMPLLGSVVVADLAVAHPARTSYGSIGALPEPSATMASTTSGAVPHSAMRLTFPVP